MTVEERLQRLEDKLDRLTRLIEKVDDFTEEMSPVARSVMDTAIRQLARLEDQGYFVFASDLREALERTVEAYQPGSLPELADWLADLMLIFGQLSKERILAAVQDVGEEFAQQTPEPVEMLGAAKRIETEKDLQRGLGFALDLLSTLGRSVSRAPRLRTRRSAPPRATRTPRTARAELGSSDSRAGNRSTEADAVAPEQFPFLDDSEWSRQWAEQLAEKLGVGPLNQDGWKIIEFSRNDYKQNRKAPNLRRITQSLGISTREIYALFPSTPGPTISKIAGVPKPAGCL